MIQRRFGILQRRLEVRTPNVKLILMTIFHLHNLAMDDVVPPTTAATGGGGSATPPTTAPAAGGRSAPSELRNQIVDALAAGGWQRPPHSAGIVRR